MSIVSNHELPRIENLAREIDPECFMIISRVSEVWGRGFSYGKLYPAPETGAPASKNFPEKCNKPLDKSISCAIIQKLSDSATEYGSIAQLGAQGYRSHTP